MLRTDVAGHGLVGVNHDRSLLSRLKRWAIVLSACLVVVAVAIQYFLLDRVLPPYWSSACTGALLVIGVAGFSAAIWRLLERVESRLRSAYAGELAQRRQAEALAAASVDLATELDIDVVAQKIVDRSREVTGARYGALGVLGPEGRIEAFYTSGIDAETRARLGPPPQGHGLLRLVSEQGKALVVDDIPSHPAAAGFPPHHPPMRTLLAAPVWLRNEIIGNLYVCDKENAHGFTEEDTEALERFAAQAAVAIQNARLHRRLQQLSIVAERERIAMDLHDGVIQSLFGVRLRLDAVTAELPNPSPIAGALDEVVDRLGNVMADVRHYIFDLRAQLAEEESLSVLLRELLDSLHGAPVFTTDLQVEGTPRAVSRPVQWELWHVCREELANAVRHSGGQHLLVKLTYGPKDLSVEVTDDGPGWDGQVHGPGHNGLENMRRRTESVGGALTVDAGAGRGTRVRAAVPAVRAYALVSGDGTAPDGGGFR